MKAKNKNWTPKLRIDSRNVFFVEQIFRIVYENDIAVDILDEDDEIDEGSLILITDHELTNEVEDTASVVVYVLPNEVDIAPSEKRKVFFQRNLMESLLASELESVSLTLITQTRQVCIARDLSRKLVEMKDVLKDYETSMENAHQAQIAIMTPPEKLEDYETFTVYLPFRSISGDVLFVREAYGKLFVMIADVTDHGYLAGMYGAALFAMANNYVYTSSLMEQDVGMWANYMQRTAKMYYPIWGMKKSSVKLDDLFTASASFAIIDKNRNIAEMCFCGSGGEPPILIKNATVKRINPDPEKGVGAPIGNGNMIGGVKKVKFFPGDQLIFYSDGATEIFLDSTDTGEKDVKKIFSSDKIVRSVTTAVSRNKLNPKDIVDSILSDAAAYSVSKDISRNKGMPNVDDDITIFCLKRREEKLH